MHELAVARTSRFFEVGLAGPVESKESAGATMTLGCGAIGRTSHVEKFCIDRSGTVRMSVERSLSGLFGAERTEKRRSA